LFLLAFDDLKAYASPTVTNEFVLRQKAGLLDSYFRALARHRCGDRAKIVVTLLLFLWLIVPIGANAAAVVGSPAPAIQSSTFDSYQLAILSAHGDRLQNAGKEQFTMTGVLSQGKAFVPFTVVRQLPNSLQ